MEHQTIPCSETVLHQTIAHIESRLIDMADYSDCAYEHALARSYHELLLRYRRRLFLLQSRRFLLSQTPALVAQGEAE